MALQMVATVSSERRQAPKQGQKSTKPSSTQIMPPLSSSPPSLLTGSYYRIHRVDVKLTEITCLCLQSSGIRGLHHNPRADHSSVGTLVLGKQGYAQGFIRMSQSSGFSAMPQEDRECEAGSSEAHWRDSSWPLFL